MKINGRDKRWFLPVSTASSPGPVCEWESPFQITSHSHGVNLAQGAKFTMLDYELSIMCVYGGQNVHMDLASACSCHHILCSEEQSPLAKV